MTMMERLLSTKEESPPVPFFNFTPTPPSDRFLFVLISTAARGDSIDQPGFSYGTVWLTVTIYFLHSPYLSYCDFPYAKLLLAAPKQALITVYPDLFLLLFLCVSSPVRLISVMHSFMLFSPILTIINFQ